MDTKVIGIYKGKGIRTDPVYSRGILPLDMEGKFFADIICERLDFRMRGLLIKHPVWISYWKIH